MTDLGWCSVRRVDLVACEVGHAWALEGKRKSENVVNAAPDSMLPQSIKETKDGRQVSFAGVAATLSTFEIWRHHRVQSVTDSICDYWRDLCD